MVLIAQGGWLRNRKERPSTVMDPQPTLLIVEDDKTQQKVLGLLAEKFGFVSVIVNTGEQALSALDVCDTFLTLFSWIFACRTWTDMSAPKRYATNLPWKNDTYQLLLSLLTLQTPIDCNA